LDESLENVDETDCQIWLKDLLDDLDKPADFPLGD
jgi:hypothetical protein